MTGCCELSGKSLSSTLPGQPSNSTSPQFAVECAPSCEYHVMRRPASLRCFKGIVDNSHYIRATEMDVTMIGLQNAGKTSLLRVLAVRIKI